MKDIQEKQTIASLDAEQFENVSLGLLRAGGAELYIKDGLTILQTEHGTRIAIDRQTVTVEDLFNAVMK